MSDTTHKPKASLGRIVIYRLPIHEDSINGEREFPAMIVRVWRDDFVNLQVFTDGIGEVWRGSVTIKDQPGEAGTCWWPPRV